MFGTRASGLELKITKLELELEALKKSFRSLESEWTDTLNRYDSIVKRLNRAAKVDGKVSGDAPAEQSSNRQELTPELIEAMWERSRGSM